MHDQTVGSSATTASMMVPCKNSFAIPAKPVKRAVLPSVADLAKPSHSSLPVAGGTEIRKEASLHSPNIPDYSSRVQDVYRYRLGRTRWCGMLLLKAARKSCGEFFAIRQLSLPVFPSTTTPAWERVTV